MHQRVSVEVPLLNNGIYDELTVTVVAIAKAGVNTKTPFRGTARSKFMV